MESGQMVQALDYLKRIEEDYSASDEAANVKALIAYVESKS